MRDVLTVLLGVWRFSDCGIRVLEKDKEWIEYKLVFSSVADKEDWVEKMKALKVELQAAGTLL
jgi:predicted flap endonuclease-1-like 5' DNA nuclease